MRNEKGQYIKGYNPNPKKDNWIVWSCPCGKQFKRRFSRIKQGKEKFCSRKCSDKHRKKMVWNKGSKGICIPWNKNKIGAQKGLKGPNNHFWKGGIAQKNKTARELIMRTIEYKKWRKNVFERDKYTCQICYRVGGTIHANHIFKWSENIEKRFDVTNGITLCKECHFKKVNWHEIDWQDYFINNLKERNFI